MSARLFENDVIFLQRLLGCCGLYKAEIDGIYGDKTNDAERAFDVRSTEIAEIEGVFDPRTEQNIRSLRTDAQVLARRSIANLRARGIDARVISGTRSYAEQNTLFRQGRFGNPGPIVTRARGGQSWHNFGLAWDIGIFESGRYLTDDQPYRSASSIGKIDGLEWGGDWRGFPDFPHYQLASAGMGIGSAREHFECGGRIL